MVDSRAEPHARAILLPRRIDHPQRLHPPREMGQLAVDLAHALAAVDVVAVLAAIAIARRPADHLDDGGALAAEQVIVAGAQGGEAGGGDGRAVGLHGEGFTPACACPGNG